MNPQKNKELRRKVRNSYIVSTVSIALVLFLLGSVGYLILNALVATNRMKENVTIHVMLRDGLSAEEQDALRGRLLADEAVREANFVSKEQAAKEFKEFAGDDFEEFLAYNPLPDSFEVRLDARASEKEAVQAFEKRLTSWPGVDEVVYQRTVIERITSNINKFNLILMLFGGTLLVISLILLHNTIRVTIYAKRYLINTMKLVGATRWFIMRPFLGNALLQGIYAALIAAVMFLAMIVGLNEGMPEVAFVSDRFQVLCILGGMLVAGMLISMLFTSFAVNKFVNMRTGKIHLY